MNLDPDSLREQREKAAAAREKLDRVIAWLDEGIDLLDPAGEVGVSIQLDAPAAPAPAPKPAQRAAKPKALPAAARPAQRDVEGKIISAVVKANRPLTRDEIAEHAGLEMNGTFRKALQRVVSNGQVAAEGATRSRRYRSTTLRPHSERRAAVDASKERNAAKLTDAVQRVGFRDRVLKAVLADPDALTDSRLAQALNAHPDDVSEACDALVMSGRLRLNADGTYGRNGMRAAA